MTHQTIYRVLCDAPLCTVATIAETLSKLPDDGWRLIRSNEHIDVAAYEASPRPRSNRLSRSAVLFGSFTLTLCPEHPDAFDGHLPQTTGGTSTRSGSTAVFVGCSCGQRLPWTTASSIVGQVPSYSPERVWWQHLPAELQWYADREPAVR
jgi:hypothetical protein